MIHKIRKQAVMRQRRGITLIEVLALVTGAAIMLGLCAVTIQLLLRLHADSQAKVSSTLVLERLARQLRDDAHASERASLDTGVAKAKDPRPSLTLAPKTSESIRYVVGDHVVARDETKNGNRIRHESYSLERDQTARFELFDESGHRMVRLLVTREPGTNRAEPPKPLEVVAALGKHRTRPTGFAEGGNP
jgi:hypothetical protein